MSAHKQNPILYSSQEIDNESYNDAYKIKEFAPYMYQGSPDAFAAAPMPLVDKPFDYIGFTNPDANGNYQTWTFKIGGSAGTTQRTFAVTYDASSNITSISRS